MSEGISRRRNGPSFSLLNLLILTAVISLGTAIILAYRKNMSMVRERDSLLSLSSRLFIEDREKLTLTAMPRVADDFYSWQVYVPDGNTFVINLGIGAVSQNGIPPVVKSVRIPSGQHRVTLFTGDSPREEFRFEVFVDGKSVFEKTMGSQWLPGGWSSASGLQWPNQATSFSDNLQLSGKSYAKRPDFGDRHFFNWRSDDYVTQLGYRLWIGIEGATYDAASPFIGFLSDPSYKGIGLRDGLRLDLSQRRPYEWTFDRPMLGTTEPVLQIAPEFIARDGSVLTSQTPSFQQWVIRDEATSDQPLAWQKGAADKEHIAYLHAKSIANDGLQPVVEVKWDVSRPDEIGLRLADTPANELLDHWRIRIQNGTGHLWREVHVADETLTASVAAARIVDGQNRAAVALDDHITQDDHFLGWSTDETLPLQIVERSQPQYNGMGLYGGLPAIFGVQTPASLRPSFTASVITELPDAPGTPFPGGPVFDEIRVDLPATERDWIWVRVVPK